MTVTDKQKKLILVSQPFAEFLANEIGGEDSYNKLQALSKLQEAVWWSEKHLSEGKPDAPQTHS